MRLIISLETEKIPVAYNSLFVAMIKTFIRRADEEYFNKLYYYEGKKRKKGKNFTFSVYVKKYNVIGEDIITKDKVILNISSPDLIFLMNLYKGIVNHSKFIYKKRYELNILDIKSEQGININSEEAIFNTLSPICIKSKEGKYLNIEDPNYLNEFNYVSNLILKNYRGYGLKKELNFENINLKKVVVKQQFKDFTQITGNTYQYIQGYKGKFKLNGDKEDLRDLNMLGVGFRRSEGFGNIYALRGENA